jgi:CubicO group peptidase (beta-lactamase class C family)
VNDHDPLAQVDGWPVRAAVAVVGPDGVIARRGPHDEAFRWASVTKLLTALATLVAWEEGTVDLDAPAGPPGATVRHLLSHASGLDTDRDDVRAAPGTRRIYSNRGIEVAADALAGATGIAFGDYLAEAVLAPLGMAATIVHGSPASAARGPLGDLALLARELLAPTLVAPATLTAATETAFAGLDGVLPGFGRQTPCDWGLGIELRHHKRPHWTGTTASPATFGHFGLAGSFLWVDPEAGIAGVGLADTDFGPWAKNAWPPLADAILGRWG